MFYMWQEPKPLNVARLALTVNWLADGRLFTVGGNDSHNPLCTVELLHWPWNSDETTEPGWTSLKPLLIPQYHHGAAFIWEIGCRWW